MSTKGYKCPCCSGNLEFNSTTQKLHCPSCENEIDMTAYQQYAEVVENTEKAEDIYNWDENTSAEEHTYFCPSCGAKIDTGATTAATTCSYCDSPLVLPEQLSGEKKPDFIIPFQLDKNAAIQAYKSFLKGKKLLPKEFKSTQKIKEITGIYVPFWLFSCQAGGTINYTGQIIKKWQDRRYEYTKTDYYLVSREGAVNFNYVPVDGSAKMDNAYMESIEPYDISKAVPFEDAYLAGYTAEKYDISREDCKGRAQDRIKTSFENILNNTVKKEHYHILTPKNSHIECSDGKIHYALLPVWVLNIKYKEQTYQFMMNGQTGKSAGELPVSSGLFWKYAIRRFAISTLIIYLLLQFIFVL